MRKLYLCIGILMVCLLAKPNVGSARDSLTNFNNDDQAQTVSGVVKDNEGNAVPGVNIVLKGTATGTITDSNGNYSINVPGGDAVLIRSNKRMP